MPTWDASAGDGEVRPHYSKRHLGATPHMWMFGSDGVQIYSADGSELVKEIPASKTCHDVPSSTGDVISRCRFSDAVSDGKKYVWSTISRGLPKMEVFSIDTGDLVGSFTTCGNPGDLDYHPLRDEMWIHCSQFSDTEQSHMDVISTLSPSIPLTTSITMHDNTNIRASGRTTVHGSLGDVGYSTVYGEPNLYKIDLSERRVLETINLSTDPKLYGYFDMAYSQKNGHIFLQSQVCCTCGFEGADALECDRYGSQNITVK